MKQAWLDTKPGGPWMWKYARMVMAHMRQSMWTGEWFRDDGDIIRSRREIGKWWRGLSHHERLALARAPKWLKELP